MIDQILATLPAHPACDGIRQFYTDGTLPAATDPAFDKCLILLKAGFANVIACGLVFEEMRSQATIGMLATRLLGIIEANGDQAEQARDELRALLLAGLASVAAAQRGVQ